MLAFLSHWPRNSRLSVERDAVLWRLDLDTYNLMERELSQDHMDQLRLIWARLVQYQQDCKRFCGCVPSDETSSSPGAFLSSVVEPSCYGVVMLNPSFAHHETHVTTPHSFKCCTFISLSSTSLSCPQMLVNSEAIQFIDVHGSYHYRQSTCLKREAEECLQAFDRVSYCC